MRKKTSDDEKVGLDDERLVRGLPIAKFIRKTKNGIQLKAKWSKRIESCEDDEDAGKVQLAVLDGMHFVAWKFQPNAKMMFYFPCGAMVIVIDGKLVVADQSVPVPPTAPNSSGNRKFGHPLTFMAPFDMKFISQQTWANFCSDDTETIFVVHQPDGFRMALKEE